MPHTREAYMALHPGCNFGARMTETHKENGMFVNTMKITWHKTKRIFCNPLIRPLWENTFSALAAKWAFGIHKHSCQEQSLWYEKREYLVVIWMATKCFTHLKTTIIRAQNYVIAHASVNAQRHSLAGNETSLGEKFTTRKFQVFSWTWSDPQKIQPIFLENIGDSGTGVAVTFQNMGDSCRVNAKSAPNWTLLVWVASQGQGHCHSSRIIWHRMCSDNLRPWVLERMALQVRLATTLWHTIITYEKLFWNIYFWKITDFTRNFWKKSFFPGDFESANSLENDEK